MPELEADLPFPEELVELVLLEAVPALQVPAEVPEQKEEALALHLAAVEEEPMGRELVSWAPFPRQGRSVRFPKREPWPLFPRWVRYLPEAKWNSSPESAPWNRYPPNLEWEPSNRWSELVPMEIPEPFPGAQSVQYSLWERQDRTHRAESAA